MKLVILAPLIIVIARAFVPDQISLGSPEELSREGQLHVAIIGAGAAGASSAYHLQKYASAEDIDIAITIYEQNPYVGGRSTTVYAYGDAAFPVELGASIFVDVNQILVNAVKEFNLSTASFRTSTESIPGAALAVWDGDRFVVTQYGTSSWWDTAKLLWKYGLAPIKTMQLMKATVAKFLKMYDEPFFPFASISQVAQDVALLAVTAATGEQFMVENGIGGNFGHDVVQASTRVNYAQNLKHIHGLEAMVCMATDGAMSVEDGNWRIFDAMISSSGARRWLNTSITRVHRNADGRYNLKYTSVRDEPLTESNLMNPAYDSVILAAPYQFSDIIFEPPLDHEPNTVPYVELHVTLFTSPRLLSPLFFGLKASDAAPKVILTTSSPDDEVLSGPAGCGKAGFWSISLLRAVTNPLTGQEEYLYKIFSPSATNATWIGQLLGREDTTEENMANDVTWLHRKVWHSYPYEYPRVTFESPFLGHEDDGDLPATNLWYTGGMDSFISTMETNALMGRNVARLLIDRWKQAHQPLLNWHTPDGQTDHNSSDL